MDNLDETLAASTQNTNSSNNPFMEIPRKIRGSFAALPLEGGFAGIGPGAAMERFRYNFLCFEWGSKKCFRYTSYVLKNK